MKRVALAIWLVSIWVYGVHAANPAMPVIPSAVFYVTNYGALGDGVKDNTTNIQNCINAANAAGGGTVEVTAGTFLSGPITLLSSINLQVDTNAMLQMLPLWTYPGGATNAQTFIGCNGVTDLEISGWGRIDGQGAAWWAYYNNTNKSIVRPMMLNLFTADRLFIHDITFQNPPYHHCGLRDNGGNITISNLTVNTPSPSPNTDGLNFVGTNCIIEDCHISDGDDDIAMGSTGPLNDLLITNCTFGSGHGVSIGSGISVGLSNLTVINCTFNGTDYGIRMKSDTNLAGVVQNLNYLNLGMTNITDSAITIYSYYSESGTPTGITPAVAAGEKVIPVISTTPVWRNILFSNISATVKSSGVAGIIWARTELPATNIVMNDVNITASKTFDVYNAQGVQFLNSTINTGTGQTFTIWNANVTASNAAPVANLVTFTGIGGDTNDSLALYNANASMTSTDMFGANPITLSGSVVTNTGNLVFSNKEVMNFTLGTNHSTVVVMGNLNLRGTVNITNANGFTATNYLLFSYTGTLTNTPALGATPPGSNFVYSLNTNTVGKVQLVVTAPSPPRFSEVNINSGAGSITISGSGGVTNGTYYVLCSTNLSLPLNQWTPVATNSFDGSGNFSFVTVEAGNLLPMFFRLALP
jgi:polygalacturonase